MAVKYMQINVNAFQRHIHESHFLEYVNACVDALTCVFRYAFTYQNVCFMNFTATIGTNETTEPDETHETY